MKFFSLLLFFILAAAFSSYANTDSVYILSPGWQKNEIKKINYCYTVKDSSGIRLDTRLFSEVTVWEANNDGYILYWKILNRSMSGKEAKQPAYLDLNKMESFPCIYKIKMSVDGNVDSLFNLQDVIGTYALNMFIKESLPDSVISDSSFTDSVYCELLEVMKEEVKIIQIYLKSYNVSYDNHEGQKVPYSVPGKNDSLFFTIDTHLYEDGNYLNTDFRLYMPDLQKKRGMELSKELTNEKRVELLNSISMESFQENVIDKVTNWILKKKIMVRAQGVAIDAEYTTE